VAFNLVRLVARRWKRYGRAAVTIGVPVPVAAWIDGLALQGIRPLELERTARLGHVQRFCDDLMERIGKLVPVTPVALACAALQTFDAEFVRRGQLLERMQDLREVLLELNSRVLKAEASIDDIFELAYRMLRMRRVIARQGEGYLILPRGRPLIAYYANSVAHLLGPFADAVREHGAPGNALIELGGQSARHQVR
jgi:glycerol-3-phosphate O-acyltransferase